LAVQYSLIISGFERGELEAYYSDSLLQ